MGKVIKILGVLVLIVIGAISFFWGRQSSQPDFGVELSKQIYDKGEKVRITVRNNTLKQICFSSCYPYYLQVKNGDWHSYNYSECFEEDLNVPCLSSGESRKFKFTLRKSIRSEIHRIAIPIDKEGTAGEKFEEDKKIYSEPFEVK